MPRFAPPAAVLAVLLLALPASAQHSVGFGYIEREGTPAAVGRQVPPWTKQSAAAKSGAA